MESYKILNQDYYLVGELMALTGINSGLLKQVKEQLNIKPKEHKKGKLSQAHSRTGKAVSKADVIRILLEWGYTRIKTKDGKDLLVRKVIEIK